MSKQIKWITRTAVLTALLLVWQMVMAPLGINLIMGSVVNLLLIVAVMVGGLSSGLTIAIISPIFASLLSIGGIPLMLAPFIVTGNAALVLVWHFVGRLKFGNKYIVLPISAVAAAITKFVVLYVLVVQIALPLLNLPPAISVAFSFPQLFTALIGGALAVIIVPVLQKVVNRNNAE